MTPEERVTMDTAVAFARLHGKDIAHKVTDTNLHPPQEQPVSIFMAGSPGAGKTEFSKYFVQSLKGAPDLIRIDPDEFRTTLPGYTGDNAYLFNLAVSILVEKTHHQLLHNHQSFMLDGTFSKPEKARENVERSLRKNRQVSIFYVYEEPQAAWRFVRAREKTEGRNIPRTAFIDGFLGARENVKAIKQEFGQQVSAIFVRKLPTSPGFSPEYIALPILNSSMLDSYINQTHTRDALEKLI